MGHLTCVDLFCGAGGFSLGFHRAGFDIAGATDINPDALNTYSHNFPQIDIYESDINQIARDTGDFLDALNTSVGEIEIVIGGPPCKGFSTAGSMDPDDPRNSLIESYLKVVEKLDPAVVVMENVEGILGMEGGKYAQKIQEELRSQGYQVPPPQKICAAAYGVPQLRTRIFFTGFKSDTPLQLPEPTHHISPNPELKPSHPELDESSLSPVLSVSDAISDLAFLGIGEESEKYVMEPQTEYQEDLRRGQKELFNHLSTNHGETVQKRLSMMPPGGTMDDIPEEYQTSKHTQQRFHPEHPAPTVTTLPEDMVHYEIPRIPTVRELARIQSFPDWFEFRGPRTTGGPHRKERCPQYSQVGNAVPPRLAEAIAEGIHGRLC
jgi:DNA (cytosine-5)-methyltransferase 1